MNEFIKKNRRLLEFYHYVTKVIGWVLIVAAPILLYLSINNQSYIKQSDEYKFYYLLRFIRDYLFYYGCLGLVLFGVARFIRYLYSEESHSGWILKHFNKFLYIYALINIAGRMVDFLRPGLFSNGVSSHELTIFSTATVFTLAYVLIIIGLSHIIGKILPVIEESKTLI